MGKDSKTRVVITGIGVVTSLGHTIDDYWNNLISGVSGIDKVTRFDPTDYPSKVASEVKDFDPTQVLDPKEVRRNDRYTQFAIAASRFAFEDAKLQSDQLDKDRFGVVIGSGIGGMETIENQSFTLFEKGPRKISPFMIPSLIANIAGGVVAIDMGARGPNFSVVSACATGSHALGESLRILQNGEADIMLAGGSEAAVTRLGFAGFCSMKAMSTKKNEDPKRASRPFDSDRDGFVMGEGAGVLVLETLEHAQSREAKIYAELSGYATTCDAYHITSPDPSSTGLVQCLEKCISNAGIKKTDLGYINAHGTSTPYNDRSETHAIKQVFGDHAHDLSISSTKSMTGHLLGAAGAIEAAACCKVLEMGEIPPTINYENPDPECDLNYVPNQKISRNVDYAMSNNSGFGGHNASLIFKKFNS
jgi:3-oxoacyl-[acyl-carrier-protein] synthase II